MSVTAFVPARSGSKRVPGKNTRLLAGKPLVVWTLQACANAKGVDKVILSTDSQDYWDIARKYVPEEKLMLDWRSSDEAGDKVKIFDYLVGARDKIFAGCDGAFILALPTVPLRRADQVEEAIAQYEKAGKPVFSATAYGFPVSFAFHMTEDGGWTPMLPTSPMVTGNTRSQDQVPAYHPNGAIYVRAIADLGTPGLKTLYDGARPYLMDANSSVDIDNESDFLVAAALAGAR
jgi:CMP-N,N'-diacetyllegionaminic acid synthase